MNSKLINYMIDLAIIGGGPAGYVAAERAGAKGLAVTLFEKRELGGVCLNEGCIPTKTLLYSAKVYNYAAHGDKYGVSAENVACDFAKVMEPNVVLSQTIKASCNPFSFLSSGVTLLPTTGTNIRLGSCPFSSI